MPITNAKSPEIWNSFLDMKTEVKTWLHIPPTDTQWDANLQLIVDMACAWVQSYCGRPFAPKQYDFRFDGWSSWNGAYIMLPKYPVLEIVSVTEYWGISGPHVLTESTPTTQVDGWQCVYPTGRVNRVFPGNVQKPWFPGSRNIEIVWIAGYNPIPPEVKVATLELIGHWYRNTQQSGAVRAGAGGGEYSPSASGAGLWEGVPLRITDTLDPYVTVGIG